MPGIAKNATESIFGDALVGSGTGRCSALLIFGAVPVQKLLFSVLGNKSWTDLLAEFPVLYPVNMNVRQPLTSSPPMINCRICTVPPPISRSLPQR